jgi:hypothetical protein
MCPLLTLRRPYAVTAETELHIALNHAQGGFGNVAANAAMAAALAVFGNITSV